MITLPDDAPSGPVLVHTDPVRTRSLVGDVRGREALIDAHLAAIDGIAAGRPVWFPVFTYDYLRSGVFSVENDVSQVGVINEGARLRPRAWRTATPVFTFAGTGPAPADPARADGDVVEPFSAESVFGQCASGDGVVLWYGAPISTATILHHAEVLSGGPVYRYDKDFPGRVDRGVSSTDVVLRYHVRPLDRGLEYDWPRIIADASAERLMHTIPDTAVSWSPARGLVEYWAARMRDEPLYLLDATTRAWVAPELERIGRRFVQSDFEGAA